MPVRATILVALDENRVAACDEKARRRIAREIVVYSQVRAAERPSDTRLGNPDEARGRRRPVNEPAAEDLVEMAVGADAPSSAPVVRGGALRVAQARTKRFGVGATWGEAGRRLFAGDWRVACRRRR